MLEMTLRLAGLSVALVWSVTNSGCSHDVVGSRTFRCMAAEDCSAGYVCNGASSRAPGVCQRLREDADAGPPPQPLDVTDTTDVGSRPADTPSPLESSDVLFSHEVADGDSPPDTRTTTDTLIDDDATAAGQEVWEDGLACLPSCTAKECGDDGCGDTCGNCGDVPDVCNVVACMEGSCVLQPQSGSCDDGDSCTEGDACIEGACVGQTVLCDDGLPCTVDVCAGGTCKSSSAVAGTPCGAKEACYSGRCVGEMVTIPAGKFPMGSPEGEGDDAEHPLHVVELSSYAIDRYEVTVAQYGACVSNGVCEPAASDEGCTSEAAGLEQHPITCVTWPMASLYCASWAGKRLPTEAEWERAANGPGGPDGSQWRRFPWSDACTVSSPAGGWDGAGCPPGESCPESFNWEGVFTGCTGSAWSSGTARANCGESDCADGFAVTAPVGQFAAGASVEGVHDLSGNVWEWAQDKLSGVFYGQPEASEKDPVNTGIGSYRAVRGGGAGQSGTTLRGAIRRSGVDVFNPEPNGYSTERGFRCAVTVEP